MCIKGRFGFIEKIFTFICMEFMKSQSALWGIVFRCRPLLSQQPSRKARDESGIVVCQQRHKRFIFFAFHPQG